MTATIGKSLNVHKAQGRADANRMRAVPSVISNSPRSKASKAVAAHTTDTSSRGRPVTQLRTIEETAELWNVSPRTVQRAIKSRALPAHRIGRLVRISDADIEAFLASKRGL